MNCFATGIALDDGCPNACHRHGLTGMSTRTKHRVCSDVCACFAKLWRPIYGGFPKTSGTFGGPPILRTTVFRGLYRGPPIEGNYIISTKKRAYCPINVRLGNTRDARTPFGAGVTIDSAKTLFKVQQQALHGPEFMRGLGIGSTVVMKVC